MPDLGTDATQHFIESDYTATSAITVTGLTVEVTATYWSGFGKIIILLLMFIGGLGIMTTGAFLLVLIGRRVSIFQRQLIKESISILPVNEVGGVVQLVIRIVVISISVQIIGFIVYLIKLLTEMDARNAIPHAVFLAYPSLCLLGLLLSRRLDSVPRPQLHQNCWFLHPLHSSLHSPYVFLFLS